MPQDFAQSLDVTGLTCPKPLLYTKKKLALMQSGQVLQILLDDKKSLEDLTFFCNATGHCILDINENNKDGAKEIAGVIIYIKVK